VNVFRIKMMIH